MSIRWKEILVSPEASIRDTIQKIDAGSLKLALVVDEEGKLLGTVSDGDIRRAILKGISLDDSVKEIMNQKPIVAKPEDNRELLLATMRLKQIQQIPVLDAAGRLIDLESLEDLLKVPVRDNLVILMAGGLGTRLYPLTQDCPKSMLEIGGRPILETIILNFIECGFRNFRLSVNHMAEMVMNHFQDGSKWGIDIQYLCEKEKMGTAGSLSLIKEQPRETIIVMNGDLLTKVNFNHLLSFHEKYNSQATMCVREYDLQVPYGVVKLDNHKITSIEEKPICKFFANAGIYALEPDMLNLIPRNIYLDMPELFGKLISQGRHPAAFPIREYWLDIGQHADFERAKNEFIEVFQ